MVTRDTILAKIDRNRKHSDPFKAFLLDYRDLVIQIADGDVSREDARLLCQVLARGEIEVMMDRSGWA